MRLTEQTRRGLEEMMRHPIWCGMTDHELAEDFGVTPDSVRRVRAALVRGEESPRLAADLARLRVHVGFEGDDDALLLACVGLALRTCEQADRDLAAAHQMARRSFGGASQGRADGPQSSAGTSGIGNQGGSRREAVLGTGVGYRKGDAPAPGMRRVKATKQRA